MSDDRDPLTDGPTELSRRSWWGVLKRTVAEFRRDNITDWAAALTYYGVLSVFPGIVVLTALLGLLGPSMAQELIGTVKQLGPGAGTDLLVNAMHRALDDRTPQLVTVLGHAGIGKTRLVREVYQHTAQMLDTLSGPRES